jgi:6-pyruvoyltetrahydropterin/6-carboxytetrahydropterin synthase
VRYTITKEFRFEGAHHLPQMPEGHKCRRPHGHSYLVRVELASDELDEFGFIEDYGQLNDIRSYIDTVLDHRDLSEIFGAENTTAEWLAERFYILWKRSHPMLSAVTICETPSVSATYRP